MLLNFSGNLVTFKQMNFHFRDFWFLLSLFLPNSQITVIFTPPLITPEFKRPYTCAKKKESSQIPKFTGAIGYRWRSLGQVVWMHKSNTCVHQEIQLECSLQLVRAASAPWQTLRLLYSSSPLDIPKQQKRTWSQYAFTPRPYNVKEQLLTMQTIPRHQQWELHKCPTHPKDNPSHLLLSLHSQCYISQGRLF